MNTRCMLYARAAALIVVIAALFLVPTAGQAQTVDCRCDHFTFTVRADVNCPVTVCYAVRLGSPIVCRSVNPGESVTIPCPVYRAWVNTCSGQHDILPGNVDALCSPILKFSADCCGRVCNAPSADLCPRLEVQPAPCVSVGCP